jgi:hypothetical protein
MTQRTLWDYAAERPKKDEEAERADRDRSRRRAFKRLRASGHWLTLLRVARTIPQPFTLNDISVAVWRAHPEFFGMKGYPYPDNHKVHYILYGTRGLIAKGIIRRVSEGLFRLPDEVDVDALLRPQAGEEDESGSADVPACGEGEALP